MNWHIVTRKNEDTFDVWIDEDDGEIIGANAIVLGAGSTRAEALADAARELSDLTGEIVRQLTAMHADAERGLQRYRETAEAVAREDLQRAQMARGVTNESQFGGRR